MKDIFEIQKALVKRGISPELNYSKEKDKFFLDLNTGAKSSLYLWEDLSIEGRYNYKSNLSIQEWEKEDDVLKNLCFEFIGCLHRRTYYNSYWGKLCKEYNIDLPSLYI